MSKHTPGPWRVSNRDLPRYKRRIILPDEYNCYVAEVNGWPEDESGDIDANARLIAHSPDMYSHLEFVSHLAVAATTEEVDKNRVLAQIRVKTAALLAKIDGEERS